MTATRHPEVSIPAGSYRGTFTPTDTIDTKTFFAERAAHLRAGVLARLAECRNPLTATMLRVHLSAGMRELDRVLQQLWKEGRIATRRRYWYLVP